MDLIGQEVLTKVLSFAISKNQLVSSFLFTGIRGIGKTTSARIVAQTINCTDRQFSEQVVVSCEKCTNCKAFSDGAHSDIVEIDAASYTSVDNIRDVIEKAMYKPVLGLYKIFIIDEVHMLSKSAFNALLKTLEEPPSHVVFILLTTELSKVPLTILSRCQKFNLKRFSINDLLVLLEKICTQEEIIFDRLALESIAYKADGSARDATVLLEQASFLAKQKNTALDIDIVKESLDLNNFKHSIDFLLFILKQETSPAINLINQLYKENFDFINIITSIIELIALLSKLKLVPNYSLGYFSAYKDDIKNLSTLTDLGFLTSLWQIFNKGVQEVSLSSNQLIAFEMLVIKAIYCALIPSPGELIQSASNETPKDQDIAPIKKKIESINTKTAAIENKSIEALENKSTPLIAITKNNELEATDDKIKLFQFISYIHKQHVFELYHFIMNECEISTFKNSTIKLVATKLEENLKLKLLSSLKDWSSSDWKIVFNTKDNFQSLQQELKSSAQNDANFKMIASFFPETKISDVWFNFIAK